MGQVTLSQKQGKKLNLRAKTQLSPALEKCCLRLSAQSSYQKTEENLNTLLGIQVSKSSLHRLVQKVELPLAQAENKVDSASIDGGKIRVRSKKTGSGEWRDYKAVNLHHNCCEAFFQKPEKLQNWSGQQLLSPIFNCLGDGHDGIWNIAKNFGGTKVVIKREILDWYHLMENLHKVKGSKKREMKVKTLLWIGEVDKAISEFKELKKHQAKCFQNYLNKHSQRIPNYEKYQRYGIEIGSGTIESTIKQIGVRVKIAGAIWKTENVEQILRLRCAYLNNSQCLSICA